MLTHFKTTSVDIDDVLHHFDAGMNQPGYWAERAVIHGQATFRDHGAERTEHRTLIVTHERGAQELKRLVRDPTP